MYVFNEWCVLLIVYWKQRRYSLIALTLLTVMSHKRDEIWEIRTMVQALCLQSWLYQMFNCSGDDGSSCKLIYTTGYWSSRRSILMGIFVEPWASHLVMKVGGDPRDWQIETRGAVVERKWINRVLATVRYKRLMPGRRDLCHNRRREIFLEIMCPLCKDKLTLYRVPKQIECRVQQPPEACCFVGWEGDA